MEHPIVNINEYLQSTIIYYYAYNLIQFRDIKGAVYLLKILKKMSSKDQLYHYKLKAYYQLANCFNLLRKFKTALLYAQRALEISFYLKSKKDELRVYDMMGLIYFHLNSIEKAKHYHTRSMAAQFESDSSPLKLMAINKFLNRELRSKGKERLNLRIIRKFIPEKDLDIENEHALYLTSSDDEQEMPMSMKISQLQKEEEVTRIIKQRSSNLKILPYLSLSKYKRKYDKTHIQDKANSFNVESGGEYGQN